MKQATTVRRRAGMKRRDVLRTTASASLLAALPSAGAAAGGKSSATNIYNRLGVPTVINAKGFYTRIGGSIMPREVDEAMDEAANYFIDMHTLHRKVGERLAEIMQTESALVTAGASAASACSGLSAASSASQRYAWRITPVIAPPDRRRPSSSRPSAAAPWPAWWR